MSYKVRVITPPAEEPVTLAEAKLDCRVDGATEDALITALIVAARQEAEELARRAFVNRTLELALDGWPADGLIELPFPPLASVTAITYLSDANVSAVMPAADYIAINDVEPGVIMLASGASWPSGTLRSIAPIRVRYVAGYGAAASVPERYRTLIRALASIRYENRNEITPAAEKQLAHVQAALQMEWGW